MTVKAWLEDHQFDLQDLAELLSSGDVRVVREDDSYYLRSPEIDNPPQGATYYEVAETLLTKINGLARAKNSSFRPVRLSGRYTDGESIHHVVSPAPAEIRVRRWAAGVVTKSDGTIVGDPPSPWPDRLALAATNSGVAEVLEILARGESLGWDDLYKVFEIIRDSIRPDTIVGLGWATETEKSAFTASANRPDVSGTDARHARISGAPPTHQMSLAEGRSFISNLVTKWLGSLAGN